MLKNMQTLKFPKGFLWGTSTSAHQVEGNNHNQWTEWEKSEKRIRDLKSRGLDPEDYISGRACDHYNRIDEDADLMKEMNHNAFRFSIEWSRIEPEEGKFNQAEIEHYRKVIHALRARNLEPFVTLWHWTLPVWFAKKGGFEKRENIKYFVRFCEYVVSEFKDNVKFWITLNEIMVYTGGSYIIGEWPPQKRGIFNALTVIANLAEAHNQVYYMIRKINSQAQIGIAHPINYYEGWPALLMRWFWSSRVLNKIKNHVDFIGLNYYRRLLIRGLNFNAGKNQRTDMNWEIYPEGIYHVLKDLGRRYEKPIYITENGLADAEDKYRSRFITDHLQWINKAIQEGIDVRGYFHWSLLDNFEWAHGFWPRFGLIEIDYKTLKRKPRSSSKIYSEIAKMGSITPGIAKMAEKEANNGKID